MTTKTIFRRRVLVRAVMVAGILSWSAGTVRAETLPQASAEEEAASAIEALTPANKPDPIEVGTWVADGSLIAESSAASVSISVNGDDGGDVTVESASTTVTIALPHAEEEAQITGGAEVVYESERDDVSVAAQLLEGGGVRALIVAFDDTAPTRYEFPIAIDGGGTLHVQPNGAVLLKDTAGGEVGVVDAPWARDANGAPVATWYTVEGDVLVQHLVFADATFPVVADPQYYQDCGIVTCTRWVSVAATKDVFTNRFNSSNATWAVIGVVKCGAAGLVTGGVGGLVCAAWEGSLVAQMNRAVEDAYLNKGCVKWKWSRQFGQGWTTDWGWTTPAATSKCKKS